MDRSSSGDEKQQNRNSSVEQRFDEKGRPIAQMESLNTSSLNNSFTKGKQRRGRKDRSSVDSN
jgi:hypothetical protein